jgi:hypothetical protein
MNKRRLTAGLPAMLIILGTTACGEQPNPAATTESTAERTAEQTAEAVDGLWKYTRLETSSGNEMPLTGVFLFKDGIFIQQAVFDGDPYEAQGAMAHAGPYDAVDGAVHLVAEQTISTAPGTDSPLSYRDSTEHDVTVDRQGDGLTLVFSAGTGTIQEFERLGPGEGELYSLDDGALAFVDGYFVLVHGDAQGVVTGYGKYRKDGEDLELDVLRWAEAGPSGATNRRDVTLQATFDGQRLALADGRVFPVDGR